MVHCVWSSHHHELDSRIHGYTKDDKALWIASWASPSKRCLIQLLNHCSYIFKWASDCFNKRQGLVLTTDDFVVSPWRPEVPACEDRPRNLGGFEAEIRCVWWNLVVMEILWESVRYPNICGLTGMKICINATSIRIWLCWWIQMLMIFHLYQGCQWPTRHVFNGFTLSLIGIILHGLICCGEVSC